MTEDFELLKAYRETGDEEAFAAIVERHIDLVYSVAYRQLGGDAQLARDLSQEVFVGLARKAKGLADGVVLTGWLYRFVRFEAQRFMRAERRRRYREREAVKMEEVYDEGNELEVDWDRARPLLDRAIGELGEKDRDAICLRFFEGWSYSEIGERLRIGESASRMRVNRALEKLGALLARDGIKSTSAALGLAVGGQVCLSAPAGLSASISQSVLTGTAAVSSGSTVGSVIGSMNTTKATVGWVSAVSVLAMGTAIYQATKLDAAREAAEAVESERRLYHSRLEELNALEGRLAELDGELGRLDRTGSGGIGAVPPAHGFETEDFEVELEAWVAQVDNLAEYLSRNPQYRIAELDYIDESVWLGSVGSEKLRTEEQFRRTLSGLRMSAKHDWFDRIYKALEAYLEESGGILPSSPLELAEYSDEGIDEAILARYTIDRSHGDDVSKIEEGAIVMREEPVDPLWDYQTHITKGGYGISNAGHSSALSGAASRFWREHGRAPVDGAELEPFVEDTSILDLYPEFARARDARVEFEAFDASE